jgi:hypothetical protein
MGDILDKLKADIAKKGYAARSIASRQWMRDKLRRAAITRSSLAEKSRGRDTTIIGKMYFFEYDPLHKKTLPYYDKFPLVFPINMYSDGFLGLNLHYLDTGLRLLLLDRISAYRTTKTIGDRTRLTLTYDTIVSTGRLSMAEECVKRYLYSQVKSQFIEVYPDEWDQAVLLPLARFVGKR